MAQWSRHCLVGRCIGADSLPFYWFSSWEGGRVCHGTLPNWGGPTWVPSAWTWHTKSPHEILDNTIKNLHCRNISLENTLANYHSCKELLNYLNQLMFWFKISSINIKDLINWFFLPCECIDLQKQRNMSDVMLDRINYMHPLNSWSSILTRINWGHKR